MKLSINRLFFSALLLVFALSVSAVPAKPGIKKMITLTDGSQIEVTLVGDEHLHYYVDNSSRCYMEMNDNVYELISDSKMSTLAEKAQAKRAKRDNALQRRVGEVKNKAIFRGERKGLIILANFTDKSFSMEDPKSLYEKIANEKGYSDGNFRGSVSDFFHDNSYGKFNLTFDIVGPIELSHNIAYYGRNQNGVAGYDIRPEQMIKEVVIAADEFVDFSDYDWDNDGEVDQIFVVYAGYNEAQGGPTNTIWPHMYNLEDSGLEQYLDGVKVSTYACSSELANSYGTQVDGIGTICHEFSHCMGFPDMYDTNYRNFGMGDWSLMNSGNYNGDGYRPAAYTSYERMVCGWLEPIELTESVNVTGMRGLTDGGESYIIYGDNKRKTEYYMLENRQPISWDDALPGKGLLIMHVDYDLGVWQSNRVNTTGYGNGHQRLTIFHADNDDGGTYKTSNQGDLYPYRNNNSLTISSVPAAIQYNGSDSAKPMPDREITDITLNDDGTISFKFHNADDDAPTYQSIFLDQFTEEPQTWEAGTIYNVHTNRLLKSNDWETLWLPFDMTQEQVLSTFGSKVTVAELTGVNEDGDVLYYTTTSEGITANTPVLIKTSTSDEYNDMGNILQMEFADPELPAEATIEGYSFVGFKNYTTEPIADFIFAGDYFAQNAEDEDGIYKAYSAYIKPEEASLRPAMKIAIDEEILNDEVDTALPEELSVIEKLDNSAIAGTKIYDLQGRKVVNAHLPKGIYIINGKKIVR